MRQEEERCRICFKEAKKGKKVALICSGDRLSLLLCCEAKYCRLSSDNPFFYDWKDYKVQLQNPLMEKKLKKLLIFAGTTEGRKLSEYLAAAKIE